MQHSKEYTRFISYFGHETEMRFRGDTQGVDFFQQIYTNGILGELEYPDLYMKLDDTVLIIEHFEFDCYPHKNGKGSVSRAEEARIDRKIHEYMKKGEDLTYNETINGEQSLENYRTNVERLFVHHYEQIDGYKKHLMAELGLSEQTIINVMFFIEETSPLGTTVLDENDKMLPVLLDQYKDFLEFLRDKNKVDFIITTAGTQGNQIGFIDLKQIEAYISDATDYARMRFIPFVAHTIGGVVTIPIDGENNNA